MRKTPKHKGKPSKRTLKGMFDLQEIFKERNNVLKGLTTNETISLFYNTPINKVKKYSREQKENKWNFIKTIKKWLIRTKQMDIIYQEVNKGTELYDINFGRRIMERKGYIFYHCLKLEEAWGYRNKMDKIGKGTILSGDRVVKTTEEEQKKKEEVKLIQEIIQ